LWPTREAVTGVNQLVRNGIRQARSLDKAGRRIADIAGYAIGGNLKRGDRIVPGTGNPFDTKKEINWPRQHAWLAQHLSAFHGSSPIR